MPASSSCTSTLHTNLGGPLRQAKRLLGNADPYTEGTIDQLISHAMRELNTINQLCGGKVISRRRPINKQSGEMYNVYLDECGTHALQNPDPFRAFVLSAAIIRESDYETADMSWKEFKTQYLGSADTVIHEPDVRRADGPFDNPNRSKKLSEMRRAYAALPFSVIAVVVHRDDYVKDFGLGPIDSSLPAHVYWTALDCLMERVVLALDVRYKGARARVIAEARGLLEDAELQYEFARLHLDGTSYIRAGWFRQVLLPGIEFQSKQVNSTGLQLADLAARPIADKVLNKRKRPYLWDETSAKMCTEAETKNSILGLKIVPWRERYKDLWNS